MFLETLGATGTEEINHLKFLGPGNFTAPMVQGTSCLNIILHQAFTAFPVASGFWFWAPTALWGRKSQSALIIIPSSFSGDISPSQGASLSP